MNESPLLVHVWEVDPAEEGVAVRSLDELFGEVVKDPGFVSARVLQTADQTSLAAIMQMRTRKTASVSSSRPRFATSLTTCTAQRIWWSGSTTRSRPTAHSGQHPRRPRTDRRCLFAHSREGARSASASAIHSRFSARHSSSVRRSFQ